MVLPRSERTIRNSALAGFLLSGFLFGLLGALLPAWGYDVDTSYDIAGRYFLALAGGSIFSATAVRRLPWRLNTRTLLVAGSALAACGLATLSFVPPRAVLRLASLAAIGMGAGLLHAGLFEAILPAFGRNAAAALNIGGIFFGAGSILAALVIAGTFYAYRIDTILLCMTILPAAFSLAYARQTFPPMGLISHPKVLKQFRSATAILFSLLLFFQFGNEWSIAGWLPIFLIHRLGVSPAAALEFLMFYFAALTGGRIAIFYLLPYVNSWWLLAGSAAASLFGCLVLIGTDNRFGAGLAIALLGLGFAAIYPLMAAWIGRRFPYYHPGFYNGIFSLALAGGMLSPWIVAELAVRTGLWAIMALPAIGTGMVMILLCLIWLQGRVTGE